LASATIRAASRFVVALLAGAKLYALHQVEHLAEQLLLILGHRRLP
jgi:hypothetical protein